MRQITGYPYYEVNFLQLGDADSIVIAYKESEQKPLVLALIDAGNVDDAETIRQYIWNNWQRRDVDIAVLTHPDKDHKGGFFNLLASTSFRIKEFWLGMPWMRHPTRDNATDNTIETPTVEESLPIFDHPIDDKYNLIQLIYYLQEKGVTRIKDAFENYWSAPSILPLFVVGPTLDFADRAAMALVKGFEEIKDDEQMEDYMDDAQMDDERCKSVIDQESDDPSTTNMSSLILLFAPPGRKFLLTGDANRASLNAMLDERERELQGCVLKVPHHGSKHNLNTELIDRLKPEQSAICCAGTKKHPNNSVVYWLSKYGNVYSTHHSTFYYFLNSQVGKYAEVLKEKMK